jgi:hypothetical protein
MGHPKYPQVDMSDREFERLLDLVDALDPVQLLRLQCKVSALIGDPPAPASGWSPEQDTLRPPPPAIGPFADDEITAVTYEDIEIKWDDEV